MLEKNNMIIGWSDYSNNTYKKFNNSYFNVPYIILYKNKIYSNIFAAFAAYIISLYR